VVEHGAKSDRKVNLDTAAGIEPPLFDPFDGVLVLTLTRQPDKRRRRPETVHVSRQKPRPLTGHGGAPERLAISQIPPVQRMGVRAGENLTATWQVNDRQV